MDMTMLRYGGDPGKTAFVAVISQISLNPSYCLTGSESMEGSCRSKYSEK